MSNRFKWFAEHNLPTDARIIQMRSVIVDYEEPDHWMMALIPIYENQYLIDLFELKDTQLKEG